jgi:hypothetical protein
MQFLINENSFIGQGKDNYDADILMKVLFEILSEIEPVRNQKPIFTHSSFSECLISAGLKVRDWLYVKSKSSQGDYQEISRILLIKLMNNGPHIDELLNNEVYYHKCKFNMQDVSGSSLAGAVYLKGIVISLQNAPDFASENIQLKYSEDGELYQEFNIPNLNHLIHAKKLRPCYVPSIKHTLDGRGIYRGRKGTPMDLSDEDAQLVLDKAIPNGRQYYGFHQERFYEFQSDNVGGFHGYPVEETEVPYKVIEHFKHK